MELSERMGHPGLGDRSFGGFFGFDGEALEVVAGAGFGDFAVVDQALFGGLLEEDAGGDRGVGRDAEAERWGEQWDAGFVLLAPTAGWGAKAWPVARYAELAGALRAKGLRVLVNAAPGEDAVARTVSDGGVAEVVSCTVRELVSLTRRAGVVVGGDTGPVHLAAALGRPVVALFGPTDPERNGPEFVGAKVRVLRDAASVVSHKRAAATEAGLGRISVEAVMEAVGAMLREGMDG